MARTAVKPAVSPPQGTVANALSRLDDPIEQALKDMDLAHENWRILQPLVAQAINLLQAEVSKAAKANGIDLKKATILLGEITAASKAMATSTTNITTNFERLVEIKQSLGGGAKRELAKLPEAELKRIVLAVAKEYQLIPTQVVEATVSE